MKETYAAFTDRMIKRYEGGYGWNGADPGGPTKYGITCYDLAEHRSQKMDSMARWAPIVQAMQLSEAEDIYATKYAAGLHYNDIAAGPDACMMDYGVNSGNSRPILVARAITGTKGTGMDQALVNAINKYDAKGFVQLMCGERLRFMHAIRGGASWQQFGKGWGARVADLNAYCLHLASGGIPAQAPPAPDLSRVPTPKATHAPTVSSTASRASTGGGAVIAGGAAHHAGFSPVIIGGIVVAVIAAGIVYEIIENKAVVAANAKVHL